MRIQMRFNCTADEQGTEISLFEGVWFQRQRHRTKSIHILWSETTTKNGNSQTLGPVFSISISCPPPKLNYSAWVSKYEYKHFAAAMGPIKIRRYPASLTGPKFMGLSLRKNNFYDAKINLARIYSNTTEELI